MIVVFGPIVIMYMRTAVAAALVAAASAFAPTPAGVAQVFAPLGHETLFQQVEHGSKCYCHDLRWSDGGRGASGSQVR